MNIVFIGPPYAGKGTQTKLLADKLQIPVYSMGALIREAYENKDPRAIEGFENYSLKGKHLPTKLKFAFLEKNLNNSPKGFILDNFPATEEDLQAFNKYLDEHHKKIGKVIYLRISEEEMRKRMQSRGRRDDSPDIVDARRENQDKDRVPVIEFYKTLGILEEIDGEKNMSEVQKDILSKLEVQQV